MVRVRLGDGQHDAAAAGVGRIRVAGRDAVLGNHRRAIAGPGVVDVEQAVAGVVGMKGEAEQAPFTASAGDQARDVEECATADDLDPATALGDEEPRITGIGDEQRITQATLDERQRQPGGGSRRWQRGGADGERGQEGKGKAAHGNPPDGSRRGEGITPIPARRAGWPDQAAIGRIGRNP